jgi:Carboxymuconolactone decarboxylase family
VTRIPCHTIDDAPPASRALLADLVQFSPTGQLLNMHAQMAHAPAVLAAYTSIRRATGELGTLDQRLRTALMLVTAAADGNAYALAITTMLARRSGWQPGEIAAMRSGGRAGEPRADALIAVIREAAGSSGRVSDATWARAVAAGCTDDDLAEAFAYLGLTVFTVYFLNYAGTELDVPASPEPDGPASAGFTAAAAGQGHG